MNLAEAPSLPDIDPTTMDDDSLYSIDEASDNLACNLEETADAESSTYS